MTYEGLRATIKVRHNKITSRRPDQARTISIDKKIFFVIKTEVTGTGSDNLIIGVNGTFLRKNSV